MSAYAIVEVEVLEQTQYDEYRKLAGLSIAQYGGRYLVRGGATEVIEGDWHPERLVVVEFSSMEQLKRWYDSPEYRAARETRSSAARMQMVFIKGYEPPV